MQADLPRYAPEPRDPARSEVQMEKLAYNGFVVAMLGSVVFLLACLDVLVR